MEWYIVVIVLIIFWYHFNYYQEGMFQRPTDKQKESFTGQVLQHRQLFRPSIDLYTAKETLPWLDPVVWTDLKKLAASGNLTRDNIIRVL